MLAQTFAPAQPMLFEVDKYISEHLSGTYYNDRITSVGTYGMVAQEELTNIILPNCIRPGAAAFYYCINVETIDMKWSQISAVFNGTFSYCYKLSMPIYLPICSAIGQYGFYHCHELKTVTLGACEAIGAQVFQYAYNLMSLYLLTSTMCTLSNINAFGSTPISTYTTSTGGVNGSIYVPSSLYDTYISATNWLTYSSRFVSLTDAQVSTIKAQMGL